MSNIYLCEEIRLHFNEPVLIGHQLCRAVGYGEDSEDCYLICDHPITGRHWHSLVGGYIWLTSLKEQGTTIPKDAAYAGEVWTDYTRLDNMLEMNGCPKEREFIIHIFSPTSAMESIKR